MRPTRCGWGHTTGPDEKLWDRLSSLRHTSIYKGISVSQPQKPTRLWEVDTLRGFAIVEMIFYHFVWDLNFFGLYDGNLLVGPWQWFARSIAIIFLFVMGVSLSLSYDSYQQKRGQPAPFLKYLYRGLQVFGLGLLITIGTYFFVGPSFVVFGILHLLGASIILGYPFLRFNKWVSLGAGLTMILTGLYLDTIFVSHSWLIWLGVKQIGRGMVDYYPLFPWAGFALLGIFAGRSLYHRGQLRFALPDLSQASLGRGLRFLGRHSLLIYLVHQPLIIGMFMALGYGR